MKTISLIYSSLLILVIYLSYSLKVYRTVDGVVNEAVASYAVSVLEENLEDLDSTTKTYLSSVFRDCAIKSSSAFTPEPDSFFYLLYSVHFEDIEFIHVLNRVKHEPLLLDAAVNVNSYCLHELVNTAPTVAEAKVRKYLIEKYSLILASAQFNK